MIIAIEELMMRYNQDDVDHAGKLWDQTQMELTEHGFRPRRWEHLPLRLQVTVARIIQADRAKRMVSQ